MGEEKEGRDLDSVDVDGRPQFTHIMIGSNDLERARIFYDATFAALGGNPGEMDARGRLIYVHQGGRLMFTKPIDGEPATSANGETIGITTPSRDHVTAYQEACAEHGGTAIKGPPSERPGGSLAAYLRDPDGNKLSARSLPDAEAAYEVPRTLKTKSPDPRKRAGAAKAVDHLAELLADEATVAIAHTTALPQVDRRSPAISAHGLARCLQDRPVLADVAAASAV